MRVPIVGYPIQVGDQKNILYPEEEHGTDHVREGVLGHTIHGNPADHDGITRLAGIATNADICSDSVGIEIRSINGSSNTLSQRMDRAMDTNVNNIEVILIFNYQMARIISI